MCSLPFKIINEMIYTEVMQKSEPPQKINICLMVLISLQQILSY